MNFLLSFMRFIIGLYVFLYLAFHALVWLTPEAIRYAIFQNIVKYPFRDLHYPPKYGLNNVHNFYLDTEPTVRVGIWHFIPSPLEYDYEKNKGNSIKEHFERYFKEYDNRPVVIYVHGNDRDRSVNSRIKLCASLCELGYHVFAIDIRGYGDSTGTPSEVGAVSDVLTLYNFIKRYQKQTQIFIWGHSLGTGITSHAAKILSEFKSPAAGIILEAPFYNISQATRDYFLSAAFVNNAWIRSKVEEHFETLNLHFDNAQNLIKTKSKILILHAEDDWLIPQDHSKELMKVLKEKRNKEYPEARLLEFHKGLSLGHNSIYTHKELYPYIRFKEIDMSNQLSYATGSTFPPQTGPLRLYSMRFCPYSQRVRLVLAAKNVPCEIININAKRRPEWYLDINSLGLVPCLQHDDGRIVNESFIISEYLDSVYPQNKLIPSDPYVKARNQMLIDGFQRIAALLFKSLKFKDPEAFNEICKILENYEKSLTEDYFGGKSLGITDLMIWPWFERFETLKSLINNELDKKRFPKLTSWVQRMQKQEAVKSTAADPAQMLEFYKVSLTNQEPDYDIGLEKPEPPPAPADEAAPAEATA